MKKFYVLFCIITCIFVPFRLVNSYEAEELAEKIKIYIEENIPLTQQFPVYDRIRNKIKEIIVSTDNSETEKRQLLKDLAFHHNNNILELVRYITSREGSIERFKEWKQEGIEVLKSKEDTARSKYNVLEETLYINSNNETLQSNDIYKISYSSDENFPIFKEQEGLKRVGKISYERKIPFYETIQEGAHKFLLYSENFFLQDGYFQTYQYAEYYPISDPYGVYKSDFSNAGFDYEDAVFLRLQDATNNVTISPKKVLMFPESYLDTYDHYKKQFINTSVIDVLRVDKSYENTYKKIIQTAQNITNGLESEQEKIKAIYDWIIQNITYPQKYDLEDYKIFSGLEAFENGSAVCEGQVLLMYYLLKIAGVEDVEYIDGYVVDAEDFPKTRHAWIQIGEYFYDPSFEKVYQEDSNKYLYYKIPYDIMYTNRYNTRDVPEAILSASKENITREIDKSRYLLTEKYSTTDKYKLLEKGYFKKRYNIPVNATITLNNLFSDIQVYKLYLKNGVPTDRIKGFKKNIEYYPITNKSDSIEAILDENNYNISGYFILEIYNNGLFAGYGLSNSTIE